MAHVRGKYLRTNYRLTGGKLDIGEMASIVVRMRQSWQHDSATGDIISFSMDGYGVPSWVVVLPYSDHRSSFLPGFRVCLDSAGSVCVASVLHSVSFGSLGATVTYVYEIIALIASR